MSKRALKRKARSLVALLIIFSIVLMPISVIAEDGGGEAGAGGDGGGSVSDGGSAGTDNTSSGDTSSGTSSSGTAGTSSLATETQKTETTSGGTTANSAGTETASSGQSASDSTGAENTGDSNPDSGSGTSDTENSSGDTSADAGGDAAEDSTGSGDSAGADSEEQSGEDSSVGEESGTTETEEPEADDSNDATDSEDGTTEEDSEAGTSKGEVSENETSEEEATENKDSEVEASEVDTPEKEASDAEEAIESSGVGNSYVASVGTSTDGLLDKNKVYDFTATFKELFKNGTYLGSAQLTIDSTFDVDDTQALTVSTSSGKTWKGGLVGYVLSLWADKGTDRLGKDEWVSVVFQAKTPDTPGVFTFETEAWQERGGYESGNPGNNNMASDHYDPSVWVADDGDTINVDAGEYGMNKTLEVDKMDVTIKGLDTGTAKIVGTSANAKQVFNVTGQGVTIENLEVTVNGGYATDHDEYATALIGVDNSGAIIKDNTIYGNYAVGTSLASMFTRGITVNSGSYLSEITGNTIHNVRNGIVVRYGNSAEVNNNVIFNTKGGIMNYTSNDADAANRTMSGNSWTSTVPGMIDHNEWDIVWNSGGGYAPADGYVPIIALSNANNGAYVLDRRALSQDGLVGNRSHVFVDASSIHNTAHAAKGNFNQPFKYIQLAIDAVVAGGKVLVAPGTYEEIGQIKIEKDLSIEGADKNTTIIKPAQNTGSSGDNRGWFLVEAGNEFNLSNVTLDGEGKDVHQAIRSHGSGTIDNNIIKNIKYSQYTGLGLVGMAGSNMTFSNNTFANIERVGMMAFGTGTTTDIVGNTYTGKGSGDWLDYGIEVGGSAKATISGNTIADCVGVASSDDSNSAGILVTSFYGSGSEAVIINNTLTDNTFGLAVGYLDSDDSIVKANNNSIYNNVKYGILSTGPIVDALNNWWGDATGPYHDDTNLGGLGNPVSDNVLFDPWWINEEMTRDSNYVEPAPGGGGDFGGGDFGFEFDFPTLPSAPTTPSETTVPPEGPLTTPMQSMVIPPADPQTEVQPLITVQFVQEGTNEELADILATYEEMKAYFDENWESMSPEEYAQSFVDLAVAWAAILARQAALLAEQGSEFDLAAVNEAYNAALAALAEYGDQLSAEQLAAAEGVLAAVAELIAQLPVE